MINQIIDAKSKENVWLKILPSIITLVGILVGIYQFNQKLSFENKQEFKRRIWENRSKAYGELGKVAANVANSTDSVELFQHHVKQFQNLYWGTMPLVQDSLVETALKKFHLEIWSYQKGESTANELRIRGYNLMKACQASLHNSWEKLSNDE